MTCKAKLGQNRQPAERLRGAQVGSALMRVLLDHPALRGAAHVRLSTKDAMTFYRRLGFSNLEDAPRYPWTSTEMIKSRAGGQRASREGSEPTDETEARAVARGEGNDERPRQAT